MSKIYILLIVLFLSLLIQIEAALVSSQLTNTSQINPNQWQVLGAVNTIFNGQPGGGSVNGVLFQDAIWGNNTSLATGAMFWGEIQGEIRSAFTASTISGPDAAVLQNIANSINFYSQTVNGKLKFWNLPANKSVQVQLITSDAAANIGNWSGIFNINTINSINSNVTYIGTFQAGTEPNSLDAQIATFDAITDANGYLIIEIDQTTVQHAGVGGIAIYANPVPEASTIIFYAISLLLIQSIKYLKNHDLC